MWQKGSRAQKLQKTSGLLYPVTVTYPNVLEFQMQNNKQDLWENRKQDLWENSAAKNAR